MVGYQTLDEVIEQLRREEAEWAANPQEVPGIPTGFPSWDYITLGLQRGEMTVVGARPSQGKTALMIQHAFAVADHLMEYEFETGDDPGCIVFFSTEMPARRLLLRYISQRSQIGGRRVRQGKLTPEERERWHHELELMKRFSPLVTIEGGKSIDITDVLGHVHAIDATRKVALVIVDYLQRVAGRGHNDYQKATDVSRRLKDLSNTMDIPVIVASQVRRPERVLVNGQWEDGTERRPMMYELRDSGNIEQDADNVLMLFNPPEIGNGNRKRTATIYVDKQRDGAIGEWDMDYIPSLTKFHDDGKRIRMDG